MHSPLAGWRVSLHRTRADWPIVAAAWLITLLAAVLLAAGPIYASAVSIAGLHRTLADAPVTEANIEINMRSAPNGAAALDPAVRGELQRLIEPLGGTIRESGRTDSFALPDQPAGGVRDLAVLGFAEGIEEHATLVSGSWPRETAIRGAPIPVAVSELTADPLGLVVGDGRRLVSRLDESLVISVQVTGIYRIDDEADPYWWDDAQLVNGVVESANYQTYGPLMTTPANLLGSAGGASVKLSWQAFPDYGRLTVDGTTSLRTRLAELPTRLGIAAAPEHPTVRTGLEAILAAAERSLLVSRTGVLLLMAQLAILAAYAIVLTAALLVDHRRVDTALLRSRGAGAWQVALLALAEGVLLAVPAVLLGPFLAVAALGLLNVAGPLAEIGLRIEPAVAADGFLAAGIAGAACVILLVLPALFAARGFAAEQGGLSRQETRTFGQRLGLDIALLAVTAIGLWQLRLYGAPLTRSVQGTLGLDPFLVAAPAIGLLSGGVVALRLLPLVAQAAETVLSRGRDLVGSLGSRQLARRPLRYTRSALLLMLAMSMGVFALSYSATWTGSQGDQARYQVGTDVRASPSRSLGALPGWALASAYRALPGIEVASPVNRQPIQVSLSAGNGELLAFDAETAPEVIQLREDTVGAPLAALFGPLRDGRPEPSLPSLPDGSAVLRIQADLDLREVVGFRVDPETGESGFGPIEIGQLVDREVVSATATLRDADGILHRISADPVRLQGSRAELILPLAQGSARSVEAAAQADARFAEPLELAAVSLTLLLPQEDAITDATIGIASLATSDDADGPWRSLDTGTDAWSVVWGQGGVNPVAVPEQLVSGLSMTLAEGGRFGILPGVNNVGVGWDLSFRPRSITALASDPVPVVVNRAFLAATAAQVGETVDVTIDGVIRELQLTAAVSAFPTTDPGQPLVIMDEPTLGLLRLEGANRVDGVDQWWMRTADGAATSIVAALHETPFSSSEVVSLEDRTRSLSADPVALGIIGALTLGFVAAGLFAIVGLTVSAAVSARQRRTEFALLRALGLSGGQLSGWLWLENASLVVISMLAGTSLGLLIGWVVLPYITVTQRAAAPFPPVIVLTPWANIALLELLSAVALGAAVVVLAWLLRRIGVGTILRMGED